jgi:SAM-dependent methyltransferase
MSDKQRLVLLSFLMLFVELALIRWTGSNIVYLSYFSNFVLLGSFLGIGLGFLRARRERDLFPLAPVALALLVLFVLVFPVEIRRASEGVIYFGELESQGPPRWLTLTVIFVAVAATMAFIGEGVARTFARFRALEAYRLDLIGSLVGVAAFAGLSFLDLPPLAWGLIASAVFVVLLGRRLRLAGAVALVALVGLLAVETAQPDTDWSPYYKVTLEDKADGPRPAREISVNGIPHQVILRSADNELYARPYERTAPGVSKDRVLIIGAGSGNDVAIALDQGAGHVDAVEIDPRLYELGRELHPDRPYSDPRVDVHVTDGRAFLERSDEKYDRILLALPDSLTLVAGQSSLRLESYLFTEQAIEAIRDHLAPGGVFAMYNYYREQWLIDRYANTLSEVFGRPPCVDSFGGEGRLAVLTTSLDAGSLRCQDTWVSASSPAPDPATDDHPFPYLREPGIPGFYLATILAILIASALAIRLAAGPLRMMAGYADLFFMGAAFLLLETKSVVQFALLFGTTWFVNALVFAGILLTVLAAVETARRVRLPRPEVLYGVLFVGLVGAYLVPPNSLLELAPVPRFLLASTITFLPIYIANLVFSQRFADTSSSTTAFGANLLGAMVGGLLEYASLLTGYRALIILVAVLYALAYVFGRRELRRARDTPTGPPARPSRRRSQVPVPGGSAR